MTALTPSDAAQLAALPMEVRQEVRQWIDLISSLTPPWEAAYRSAARTMGVSAVTVRRKVSAFRAEGWRALINRSKVPAPELRNLSKEFLTYWGALCGQNQRKCKPAHRELLRRYFAGEEIPGVPIGTVRDQIPEGWSYENLMRHKPSAFELKAFRIGRSAAISAGGPMVYTTRRELWVGSHYLFDDMVHDHFVNVLDTRKAGRPVEFHALDLYSACKVAWGIACRTESDLTGRMESLKEEHMRFLVANLLTTHGYHPERGTTMVVENGTAAIKEDLERILHDLTGGQIAVRRSGMEGDPAFTGQYAGRGKGNFRFKAALETLGNLIHNEMGMLPGQTGKDTDHRPEQIHGLLRHNDALRNAITALALERPDRAALLRMPILSMDQFRGVAEDIYRRINARTEHRLEGWEGLVAPDVVTGLMRRLSPSEVWQMGRKGLATFRPEQTALVLFRDCADEVRITDRHEVEIQDRSISADGLRFDAAEYRPGEKYQAVLNPFASDRLYLFDARGSYVGALERIARVSRGDDEAIRRAMGKANHLLAERLKPVAQMGREISLARLADLRANAEVLADESTPDARARQRAAAAGARMAQQRAAQPGTETADEVFAAPNPDAFTGEEPVDEVIG
jgi:hypothetical protein